MVTDCCPSCYVLVKHQAPVGINQFKTVSTLAALNRSVQRDHKSHPENFESSETKTICLFDYSFIHSFTQQVFTLNLL